MKQLITLFFLSVSLIVSAVIPSGYYNTAVGKSDASLRTTLQSIITNKHSVTSYSGLYAAYSTTDINPTNGKIWDIYSNCNFTYGTDENHGTSGVECTNYNREHTTPQSWFNEASPMVSDLFNVYPTDTKVNGMRSNYPYGEVSNSTYVSGNGSKLGSSSIVSYSGTVFEPIAEFKGDIARTFFYMATRYASDCQSWGSGASSLYGSNMGLSSYAVTLFLKWARQDPVSTKEINRNNAVEKIQKNRNPFIDYPELAEYIWGNKKGTPWSLTSSVDELKVEFSILPNPVKDELVIKTQEHNANYIIYNLNGQTLKQGNLAFSNLISMEQFDNGMYLLQLNIGKRKTIQKFIVSK